MGAELVRRCGSSHSSIPILNWRGTGPTRTLLSKDKGIASFDIRLPLLFLRENVVAMMTGHARRHSGLFVQ